MESEDKVEVPQELKELAFQFQGDLSSESSEFIVAGLVKLQDGHEDWRQESTWPGPDERKYAEALLPDAVAEVLVRGFTFLMKAVKLTKVKVQFLNQNNWASKGDEIRFQVKKVQAWMQPSVAYKIQHVVTVNFQFWVKATPLQRIAVMLEAMQEVAGIEAHQALYNRIRICGAATFEEDVALFRAMQRGAEMSFEGQLDLLEEESGESDIPPASEEAESPAAEETTKAS